MPIPLPTMPNVNFSLDMKNVKWNWPTYLTFGKGSGMSKTASSMPSSPSPMPITLAAVVDPPQDSENGDNSRPSPAHLKTSDVDTASLLEAITTESMGSYTRAASPALSALSKSSQLGESHTHSALNTGGNVSPVDGASPPDGVEGSTSEDVRSPPSLPPMETILRPTRSFFTSTVHVTNLSDAHAIQKKRVLHLTVSVHM